MPHVCVATRASKFQASAGSIFKGSRKDLRLEGWVELSTRVVRSSKKLSRISLNQYWRCSRANSLHLASVSKCPGLEISKMRQTHT